ncbi:MAG: hypothetical protein WCF67_17270 [Chitinophagaceae bacterium]
MSRSLRKDVQQFAKVNFPEVYGKQRFVPVQRLLHFFNSPNRGLLIIPIILSIFMIGQIINPPFLQWMHISSDTARIIIDQRTANLATIFSITLVVIGWLLTNLSVRESLSFQLLFKKTYLYPIFYFVSTLTACLILFSLLRHESFINLPNIVIAGTGLIILALILITTLFIKFINVVDSAFLYNALSIEVMKEIHFQAQFEIPRRRSTTEYSQACEIINLTDGIRFNTDLSNHTGINITPLDIKEDQKPTDLVDLFASKQKFEIVDINLEKLKSFSKSVNSALAGYYRPLHLGSQITENFHPFYFEHNIVLPAESSKKLRKVYKLRTPREPVEFSSRHLTYFNERFLKDVKEGKKENIENGLEIYARIFDLENKINSLC